MSIEWANLEESERAFAYEWIEQCEIREHAAAEDSPAPDYFADHATLILWVDVMVPRDVRATRTIALPGGRELVCRIHTEDMGASLTKGDGTEESACDVFVIVPCAEVRRLLGRPRCAPRRATKTRRST